MVDAIAGGGGLLTLPALLAVGLPPHLALGTNKGASVFGSGSALLRFARAGLIRWPRAQVSFPAGLVGALLGAAAVLVLEPEVLRPVVLILLVAAALVVATYRPKPTGEANGLPSRSKERWTSLCIGVGLGAYDGFFGPGTGTFLILAFVTTLGDTLSVGSANAKVVNFASNLGALALFATRGVILWSVAVPMAAAQFAGGWTGAHLAIRGGDRVVRRVVLAVVLALVLKLARDFYLEL